MTHVQRKGSLHDSLVETLGTAIVHGTHPVGSRLVTSEVADAEGASRTAAREAVRVLESLGLVQVRRKSGIEVRPESEWNEYAPEVIAWRLSGAGRETQLGHLGALRGAVEPLAASLAAGRASEEERQTLVAAVMEMARTEHDADGAHYLAADVRFHRTMLRASGNPMLAALGDVVESVLVGRTRHALMPHDANPDAVRWHQDAAFAIVAGRSDDAAAALRRIVAEADAALRAESAEQASP
ncbi:FCD domain-containing protein [Microbacterium sp. cx-55]|uniref:FadR/GntR family transcriptional regulator n=1 Tax=unclassified Microbacterium TaxID=2609290 RepID=UPI001CBB5783|nr:MULTISPECIES: FCD domain-containing protein [unclassified Microbacterium]MBZ4485810.1 FCD domain-containing protein [Microbacterium sp. cx-55]MCC4906772.1 FCD domain-containing protein [Microbacterium sp. cx-59]UGB34308.1 FCD domain-containing protein [Microbacterium sp. cx-55]